MAQERSIKSLLKMAPTKLVSTEVLDLQFANSLFTDEFWNSQEKKSTNFG